MYQIFVTICSTNSISSEVLVFDDIDRAEEAYYRVREHDTGVMGCIVKATRLYNIL